MVWFVALLAAQSEDVAARLRELSPVVVPAESDRGKALPRMLYDDARVRLRAANARETNAWRALRTREDWEKYRDAKIRALRESLGSFPPPPADLKARVTRTVEGEGYRIENVVFESRPGLLVAANLYAPAKPPASMPGVLVIHSHHNPKTQGELQDMGILWARAGCSVVVMDQLGHGERRQHAFKDASSYPAQFRPTRQDYAFRYNSAAQLHLVGESLVGWMAWDQMRAVDLLLSRPGIDRERIILLGSVAGGGDPAGVTGAIDPRISCLVPFNFGGPQPETPFPLPDDAEMAFNYAGSGSWESTRNLRLSARDGFLPWVIVGSVAPRHLIHAHEFAWDRERDPVWKRYQKLFEWYGKPERLDSAKGRGSVRGQPPESTHCNNIGAEHRKAGIYAAFERWFGIAPPEKEPAERRPAEELHCVTPDVRMLPLHELLGVIASERLAAAQARRQDMTPEARRAVLRREWARLLGDVEPARDFRVTDHGKAQAGDVPGQRLALEIGSVTVPFLLLVPPREGKRPSVVAFGQEGKAGFLRHRSKEIADLLAGGAAVCLADLRGTGETRPGNDVGRTSGLTSVSATEQMLGQTLPGLRLRDLRTLLSYLRARPDLDGARIALWGDSFAPANPPDARIDHPWDAPKLPDFCHPAGALVALFGMLFEEDLRAAWGRGGLESFASVLGSPYLYVPHDAIIPGALTVSDLDALSAAIAPRRVRFVDSVDGLNRRVGRPIADGPASWLLEQLR
jgi:cephalosporin-C deacetylase-like acetyl esterase